MIIAGVLFKLPIFFEVNWKESLIRIYIIHRHAGIPIFHKRFREQNEIDEDRPAMDEELVAGGMLGIATMLKEISQSSEDLKIIDHGDQKILLDYGDYFFIALNVQVEMKIYWDKMEQLKSIVAKYYNKFLVEWSGDMDVFSPIENIINEIF